MITVEEIKKIKTELYTIISDHSGQPFEKVIKILIEIFG